MPHIALSVLCIHVFSLSLLFMFASFCSLFLAKPVIPAKKSNENQLNIEQIFRPNDRFEIKQWAPLHQVEAPTSCRFYLSESLRSLFLSVFELVAI